MGTQVKILKGVLLISVCFQFTFNKGWCQSGLTHLDSLGFTNKSEAKNLLVNGKKEGKWIIYKDRDWKECTVDSYLKKYYVLANYKNGEQHGKVRGYFFNTNTIYSEKIVINGVIDGEIINYFENGNVSIIDTYVMGNNTGPFKNFYESGQLKCKGKRSNGQENGITTWYDKEKRIIENITWNMGKKVRSEKFYPDFDYTATISWLQQKINLIGREDDYIDYVDSRYEASNTEIKKYLVYSDGKTRLDEVIRYSDIAAVYGHNYGNGWSMDELRTNGSLVLRYNYSDEITYTHIFSFVPNYSISTESNLKERIIKALKDLANYNSRITVYEEY